MALSLFLLTNITQLLHFFIYESLKLLGFWIKVKKIFVQLMAKN